MAREYAETANRSIEAAMMSLDCEERDAHAEVASTCLFQLEMIVLMNPWLKVTSTAEFQADLHMIREATKARRSERYRKARNIPQRY